MTTSILSLQEILTHCRTLAPSRRAFYDTLLTHGDVLAVRVNYLPGSLLWLVTTPTQAGLMRERHDPDADVEVTIMSLQEARDLLTIVGDAEPATVYEAAAWLWLRRQWCPRASTKVRKRLPMTVGWPAIVVAMLLPLSGCATTWSRAATSDAEFNLDNRACQHMNTQTVSVSSVQARDYVAVYGYKRCMIEEGYTEGGIWKGYSGWRNE